MVYPIHGYNNTDVYVTYTQEIILYSEHTTVQTQGIHGDQGGT